jgi:hypothetical protein
MRKFSGTTFLKVDDVRDGPLQLQIAVINEGQYDKPDVVFETGETLSLNATNTRTLVRAYGPNSDDWIGKEVELKLGQIKYQGSLKDAVIVEPVSPPTEAAEKNAAAAKMNDEIPF